MIRVFTDRIYLNDGTEIESCEYAHLTTEQIEQLGNKLEDNETMTKVAMCLGFEKTLDTDESDWDYIEGDYEDLGREIVERDYSFDWDLAEYFNFYSFGRNHADYIGAIEVDGGFLIEQ